MLVENNIVKGFSKLSRIQKASFLASTLPDESNLIDNLELFRHPNPVIQKKFDEYSENTLSNYFLPYGVAPNFLINGKVYHVPMVIEESSVVAAASAAANFWAGNGGFIAEVEGMTKVGQIHFSFQGEKQALVDFLEKHTNELIEATESISVSMKKRGGGVVDIHLTDLTDKIKDIYYLHVNFNTGDAMGANYINSCLEAMSLRLIQLSDKWFTKTNQLEVIMAILSNFTPNCRVKVSVSCDINALQSISGNLSPDSFAQKFKTAVDIAKVDTYRAVTHNKGIFNGIDAVILATGNDLRATSAAGHAYAVKENGYTSLTSVTLENSIFAFNIDVPMAVGVVGGLTKNHPLAAQSLQLLGNPSSSTLMMIAASVGLASNFSAIKALITSGIQKGHMKMHLSNILNQLNADGKDRSDAELHFENHIITFSAVENFLANNNKT